MIVDESKLILNDNKQIILSLINDGINDGNVGRKEK
jgi:hypothetical protein